jgi:hypothetical protein
VLLPRTTHILGKECPLMLATSTRLENKLSNFISIKACSKFTIRRVYKNEKKPDNVLGVNQNILALNRTENHQLSV